MYEATVACTKVLTSAKRMAHELIHSDNASPACKELCSRAHEKCKALQSCVDELDALLITEPAATTDAAIKAALTKTALAFAQLQNQEYELTSLFRVNVGRKTRQKK